MKKYLAIFPILIVSVGLSQRVPINPAILKQTFVYAVKSDSSLALDVYRMKDADLSVKKPAIIFVFGGAFVIGRRDDTIYNAYFNTLTANNNVVISISYRLGLRGVQHVSKFNIKPLKNALDMAVADLYDATNWVIKHADSLGIDTSRIILSGSSSGAITTLTAEFERKNEYAESGILPSGFQYAGLITFSGAILSLKGKLSFKNPPAPRLMFHGTEDKIVPYKKIKFFNKGFYGSEWIAKYLKEHNIPYYLFSEEGMGHEIAVLPMIDKLPVILDFLDEYILQHEPYQIDLNFKNPDQKPLMLQTSAELMKKLNNP
ncbi:MAG TPA: carboxylesterase family protein [Puia sp.]|jgi:predicted esterase|nr:carboxylesterase family protein [Puia sp.]